MQTPAPFQKFVKYPYSKEQVFGALLLALRILEWDVDSIESEFNWVIKTGISDAANDELISIKCRGNTYEYNSHSIGEIYHSMDENEKNIYKIISLIENKLKSETSAKLIFTYREFIEENTQQAQNEIGIRWLLYTAKDFLLLRKPASITFILTLANVLIFIIMAVSGVGFFEMNGDKLIAWGANYTIKTASGEYWRLLSNTFLHGGLQHLASNLYGLILSGFVAESLLGKRRFLIAYLVCGIFASAVSFYMHDEVLSVGASGAIFGAFGLVLGMASTRLLNKRERKVILWGFGIFIVINLLLGLKDTIDNWAHLGGLVSGWIGGIIWAWSLQKRENIFRRRLLDWLIPLVAICVSIVIVKLKPDSIGKYKYWLEQYDENVNAAFIYLPSNVLLDSLGTIKLHDSGMYLLREATAALIQAKNTKGLAASRREYVYQLIQLNEARYKAFYFTWQYYSTGEEERYNDSIVKALKLYEQIDSSIANKLK